MSEQFPRELWENPAFHKGREWGRMEREAAITKFLEEERRISETILSREDCSSDCYKCELIGGSTLGLIERITTFLNGEENA